MLTTVLSLPPQEIARQKIELASEIPDEPPLDRPDCVRISIKLPDGSRIERRFSTAHSLKVSFLLIYPSWNEFDRNLPRGFSIFFFRRDRLGFIICLCIFQLRLMFAVCTSLISTPWRKFHRYLDVPVFMFSAFVGHWYRNMLLRYKNCIAPFDEYILE